MATLDSRRYGGIATMTPGISTPISRKLKTSFLPGKLYFAVSQTRSAVGGPRLVVQGARLVNKGAKVRVKVACLGASSQTCSGIVRIRKLNKVIAKSSTLTLKAGKTEKVLLKVAGAKKAKAAHKSTKAHKSKKA